MSRSVRPIAELGAGDLAIAGGKGANLGELARAGLPVPDGFVITTDAYRSVADGIDTSDPAVARTRIRTMTIPEVLSAEVLDAYRALGEGRVAVRSSATA